VLKVALFRGEDENGVHTFPLFGPSDAVFEKTAAPDLLPEVARYIASLKPSKNSQYVLVNAMGASEYWGANVNGDAFTEECLIHKPDDWTGNPLLDKIKAKEWAYGFPTFYNAHPFAHHRNKDAKRAFGEVELAAWHPRMKRVELVVRVDADKCHQFGGTGVWDKLHAGQFVDVSMGTRVPFDTSSITLDWETYRKAQATFDSKKHRSPGDAVLEFHKDLIKRVGHGIRGVSITRNDYDEFTRKNLNRILPDGRKVFVFNDYPRFFDISFVFIGADKTAKVMMKIAGEGKSYFFMGGAELAEKLGYDESIPEGDKLAAVFFKGAKDKGAEIIKDTLPSQFAAKAVPVLTAGERDIPRDILDMLGESPLEEALSTPSSLGMILRPREFQRIILLQMGNRPLADELERKGTVFPKTEEKLDVPMGPEFFSAALAQLLLPLLSERSAFGTHVEQRILLPHGDSKEKRGTASSLPSVSLRKIGAAYNGYRTGIMDLVAHAQEFVSSSQFAKTAQTRKLASASVDSLFTPLSAHYLKLAYWDEVGVPSTTVAGAVEGAPSSATWPAPTGDS
jgi:hypothetical protein